MPAILIDDGEADIDNIEGLSRPCPSSKNRPRTIAFTVGTVTEIHDYLRLLFARAGTPSLPSICQTVTIADLYGQTLVHLKALLEACRHARIATR